MSLIFLLQLLYNLDPPHTQSHQAKADSFHLYTCIEFSIISSQSLCRRNAHCNLDVGTLSDGLYNLMAVGN